MSVLENFHTQIKGPAEGRKWIFLHGLMGFSANWLKVVSELQKTENCLVFDQRGHGRSFQPGSYRAEDYASDLFDISNELGWERFVLVGHSMGGRNAMLFARDHADKIEKLILEDISPEVVSHGEAYYENLLNLVPAPFPNRESAKLFFQNDFIKNAKTRENVQIMSQFFYANMAENSQGQVDWRFSKRAILETVIDARHHDYWKILRELKVPTLSIRGANSPEYSRASFEKVLAVNTWIQGVEIPNAGHWVHADQPQVFTDVLKDFVGVGTRTTDSE